MAPRELQNQAPELTNKKRLARRVGLEVWWDMRVRAILRGRLGRFADCMMARSAAVWSSPRGALGAGQVQNMADRSRHCAFIVGRCRGLIGAAWQRCRASACRKGQRQHVPATARKYDAASRRRGMDTHPSYTPHAPTSTKPAFAPVARTGRMPSCTEPAGRPAESKVTC